MSKWKKYNNQVDKRLLEGRTDWSNIAREILIEYRGFDFDESSVDLFRTYIKRRFESNSKYDLYNLSKYNELASDISNPVDTTVTVTNQYDEPSPFVITAWDDVTGKMMDIMEYCDRYSLPYEDISSYKLVTHTGTPYYNIAFKSNILTQEVSSVEDAIIRAVDSMIDYPMIESVRKRNGDEGHNNFTRLIFSDTHIGMETNSEGIAMYATPWNENTIIETFSRIANDVLDNRKGNILYIDDLGDFLDGYDSLTTRGGHALPQNMSNIEGFEVGLRIKLTLIKVLQPFFNKIVCHNVCNTNHDGDWGAALNIAFKSTIDAMFSNVEVFNINSFMGHYFVGDHAFILCHGKDKKNLKFGFKPVLDSKQIEHIENYINFHGIYTKAKYIEFSKGDSHQLIRDWSTAQGFNYMNYLALSPSSEWVQTNFKQGSRGFTIQTGNKYDGNLTENNIIIR